MCVCVWKNPAINASIFHIINTGLDTYLYFVVNSFIKFFPSKMLHAFIFRFNFSCISESIYIQLMDVFLQEHRLSLCWWSLTTFHTHSLFIICFNHSVLSFALFWLYQFFSICHLNISHLCILFLPVSFIFPNLAIVEQCIYICFLTLQSLFHLFLLLYTFFRYWFIRIMLFIKILKIISHSFLSK